jgi:hypothetical protein
MSTRPKTCVTLWLAPLSLTLLKGDCYLSYFRKANCMSVLVPIDNICGVISNNTHTWVARHVSGRTPRSQKLFELPLYFPCDPGEAHLCARQTAAQRVHDVKGHNPTHRSGLQCVVAIMLLVPAPFITQLLT